jgi:signal transduction histidine kinase
MDVTKDLSPILIVDDVEMHVSQLIEAFADMTIRADKAYSGREALSVLRGHPPGYYKAMILDIEMETKTTGLDILKDIRSHDSNLPIVYLSSFADETRLDKAIEEGAAQMLKKPVEFIPLYYSLISAVRFANQQTLIQEEKNKRLLIIKLFNHNMKNLALAGQAYLQSLPPAVESARLCFNAIQDQTGRVMAMNTEPDKTDASDLTKAFEQVKHELAGNPQLGSDAADRVMFAKNGSLPQVHIKLETLAALLTELVSNALLHNTGRAIHVTVSARAPSSGTVEVRVEDDGMGVPAERRNTLFQVQQNRSEHGFGLPYCYEVIRIHGGDLMYERVDTGGGAFRFTLPIHGPTVGREGDA